MRKDLSLKVLVGPKANRDLTHRGNVLPAPSVIVIGSVVNQEVFEVRRREYLLCYRLEKKEQKEAGQFSKTNKKK